MKKLIISSLIVILIFAFMLISCNRGGSMEIMSDSESVVSAEDIHNENEETFNDIITVDVCGAVVSPGVYDLNNGDRIIDAINAAGGLLEEANADTLNKADFLKDGQQVRVPFMGEESITDVDDGKININTADISKLTTLPGIGETRAQAIIDYREANGDYANIEDIMNVTGIKEGTYNKFCDMIKVN